MRWSDILNERQGPAVLYHASQPDNASRIIYTDKLIGYTSHPVQGQPGPDRSQNGVSLTRSLQFAKGWRGGGVIFVLDRDKLRQNYRLQPVDYQRGTARARSEAEEFVASTISPLSRYLVEIIMPQALFDECVDDNDDYVDPHSREDTRYAALTDHPLLKII